MAVLPEGGLGCNPGRTPEWVSRFEQNGRFHLKIKKSGVPCCLLLLTFLCLRDWGRASGSKGGLASYKRPGPHDLKPPLQPGPQEIFHPAGKWFLKTKQEWPVIGQGTPHRSKVLAGRFKFSGPQEIEFSTHLSGAASHCLRAIHSNSWCRMFCTRPTGHDVEALFEYLFSVSRHLLRRPNASGKFYKGERVRVTSWLQQPRISLKNLQRLQQI